MRLTQNIRRVDWDGLDVVDRWRRYLNNPHAFLRHMTDTGKQPQPPGG